MVHARTLRTPYVLQSKLCAVTSSAAMDVYYIGYIYIFATEGWQGWVGGWGFVLHRASATTASKRAGMQNAEHYVMARETGREERRGEKLACKVCVLKVQHSISASVKRRQRPALKVKAADLPWIPRHRR